MAIAKQTQLLVSLPIVVSLMLLLTPVNSQPELRFKVCGQSLNDVLYGVCQGHYAPKIPGKRSFDSSSLNLYDYVELQNDEDDTANTRWSPRMNSILATNRLSRAIVDECCAKACTISHMKNYCS